MLYPFFSHQRRTLRRHLLLLLGLCVLLLAIALHGGPNRPAFSSTQPVSPIPVLDDPVLGTKPDWSQITFQNLPPILESGSFQVPTELIYKLGYDPSRIWQAGQTADQYMLLGDFQDTFALQQFSLSQLDTIVGLTEDWRSLTDFELLNWQSLRDLVQAIPGLGDFKVEEVLPLAELLQDRVDLEQTIGRVAQNEILAELNLEDLGFGQLNIDQYGLDAIPGLMDAPLENFQDWQHTVIEQVPGLGNVPFSDFPNPNAIVEQGAIASRVDIVFSSVEGDRTKSVSGSYQEGFNVACQVDCAHFELGTPLAGAQWISGSYQQVQGGEGVLAAANGGLEPTGRHPFGKAFKVAMLEPDEASGTAAMGLYFRKCIRYPIDLGCTPYFIGPVPWIPVQEEGTVILGLPGEGLSAMASQISEQANISTLGPNGIDQGMGQQLQTDVVSDSASGITSGLNPSGFIQAPFTDFADFTEGLSTGTFLTPVDGASVAQHFGDRTHPTHGDRRLQPGTQFDTPPNTVVKAADGGQVISAGDSPEKSKNLPTGKQVIIDHGNGIETRYAHLSDLLVKEGDLVPQGAPLGHTLQAETSPASSMQFEVYKHGQPVDPMSLLQQQEGL